MGKLIGLRARSDRESEFRRNENLVIPTFVDFVLPILIGFIFTIAVLYGVIAKSVGQWGPSYKNTKGVPMKTFPQDFITVAQLGTVGADRLTGPKDFLEAIQALERAKLLILVNYAPISEDISTGNLTPVCAKLNELLNPLQCSAWKKSAFSALFYALEDRHDLQGALVRCFPDEPIFRSEDDVIETLLQNC